MHYYETLKRIGLFGKQCLCRFDKFEVKLGGTPFKNADMSYLSENIEVSESGRRAIILPAYNESGLSGSWKVVFAKNG